MKKIIALSKRISPVRFVVILERDGFGRKCASGLWGIVSKVDNK